MRQDLHSKSAQWNRRPRFGGAAASALIRSTLALALASAASCARDSGPAADGLPRAALGTDVVLVTLDTTRADRLGAYGRAAAATPHLDELARAGALFESAFSPVPTTLASHASIMTGTYPPYHGVRFNLRYRLADRPPTLAQVLSTHGYRAVAVVAAAVLDRKFGVDRGFDVYDDHLAGGAPSATGIEERPADRVTDAAIRALGAVPPGVPVFLWAHYYDPHAPYSPPPEWQGRCGGDAYQGEIAFMDSEIGRLLAAVRARSEREPIIVAVADHGESLGEHGEDTHGLFVYDATVRVPLIVSGAVPRGARVPDLASTVDVTPTILDLLGLPRPSEMQGESLLGLVHGTARRAPDRGVYLETFLPRFSYGWSELVAIRTPDAKFVRAPRPELYDLRADPAESVNLLLADRARGVPLERALLRLEESVTSRDASRAETESDPETEARLAALGYVAARGAAADSSGPRPDPKEMAAVHREMERLQAFITHGRVDEARALADSILESDRANVHVLRTIGNALYDRGDVRTAIEYLIRAATIDPLDVDLHQKIGNAHLHLARRAEDVAAARTATEKALAEFEAATSLNPNAADAHNNVGITLQLLGRPAEAERSFRRALDLRESLVSARYNLARLLEASGRTSDAEAAYREVVRYAPRDAEAWFRIAALAAARGQGSEALAAYRAARAESPRRFDGAIAVARALSRDGRPRDGAALLEEARSGGETGAALIRALGVARREAGDAAGAVDALEEAVRETPNDPDVLDDLALALMDAGRFEDAAERFARHASLRPTASRPAFHRGVALEKAGLEAEAAAAYEEASRRDPADTAPLNALAWILATSRDPDVADPDRAVALAERATRGAPRTAAYLDTLAEARLRTGDRAGALRAMSEAIETAPPNEREAYERRRSEMESRR